MQLLFVADLHYALKQFDWMTAQAAKYDAVVIGGDLLDISAALEVEIQIVVMEKYFERLCRDTVLIVSSGNHDGDRRTEGNESVAGWLREAKAPRVFVDGDSVDLGDALITVCPWWDGPVSRGEVEAQIDRDAMKAKSSGKRRWIWIHHAPPDRSPVSWTGRKYGGDEFLVNWIQRYQPDAVMSGHIHNAPFYEGGSWVDRLGRTWVFNPGRQIGPRPTSLTLDLNAMTMAWESLEGRDLRYLEGSMDRGAPSSPVPSGVA
ncbi:MAG: metallophosphoesterase [Verrucomicrobiales bacterium]|nr:metallophosphoesterase [Verrucomicrobiales bacterium]